MPNVAITLTNTDESVSQPLVADLTQQLQKFTGLNFVDDVRFINYNGSVRTYNSGKGEEQERYASFSGKTRLFVEAEEDYNENGWASTVVERIEHVPLFADPDLGVWITPVYVPCDLTLKVRFQTRSRDEARRWRDEITMRLAQLREGIQHVLTFSINLPKQVWGLVEEIWTKRETIAGYGDTLLEYIKQHSHKDLTLVSNATGQQASYAFRRRLARVNGRFEISPLPEKPTFDESGGVWECTMNYKITYDRPVGCVVRYPIQVHQQFLQDKYIIPENDQPNMNDKVEKELSQSQKAFSMFESYSISGYYCHQDAYIQIPRFDDYVYRSVPKGTATVLLGLLQMEKPGNQLALNLDQLGDYVIDEDILNFIREVEYPYLNKPFQSFFGLNLYRNDDLVGSEFIECQSNLDVNILEDVDLRKSYRVRFYIVVDPALLPLSAFERLYKYPNVIWKLVQAINDALRYSVDFPDLLKLRPLHPWEFTELWHMLNGLRPLPEGNYGNSGYYPKPGQGFGKPNRGQGDTGYVWNGNQWVSRKPDNGKSKLSVRPNDKKGNIFGIPDWAYERIKATPKMRTVQIQNTIAYAK